MDTKTKLVEMLTENTGKAMGDSGGAYGRNWERNQGRDFESEPEGVVELWGRDGEEARVNITLNVYHWLASRITYNAEMDATYQAFADSLRGDEYELNVMELFPDHLAEKGHDIGGIYGDGEPITVNTYNCESNLSQVLQYTFFTCDGTPYILLQIHGGCDVRGGYTDAVVFTDDDDCGIFHGAEGSLYGEGSETYWSTDDAYNWYSQTDGVEYLHKYVISHDTAHKGDGVHVYVDDDARPYCPISGGLLIASA